MRVRAASLVWILSALALLILASALVLLGNPGPPSDTGTTLQETPTSRDRQNSSQTVRVTERAAVVATTGTRIESSVAPSTEDGPAWPIGPVDPETSNVTGVAFTVSWLTSQPTVGVIHWGLSSDRIDRVAQDIRGANIRSETHYVRVTDLEPNTDYYFDVVTDDEALDDNGGQHYMIRTGPLLQIPGMPVILFGRVFGKDNATQISGALLTIVVSSSDAAGSKGAQPISVLSANDGSWAIELSSRTADLQHYYAATADPQFIHLRVAAGSAGLATEVIPFDEREEPLSLHLQ